MRLLKEKAISMRINYLHHSAVCVTLDQSLLVFDHYQFAPGKSIPAGHVSLEDIKAAGRAYVFASHAHHDHFDRQIFEWAKAGVPVTFILDDTIPTADAPEDAVFLSRGGVWDDGYIHVQEFGSTDIGGSFYVECEGSSYFHAGDLNDWHWKDEGNERYSRVMHKFFERELAYLRHEVEHIDYAFFPVDKRMGCDYDEGADRFIEVMRPQFLIPIHFVDFADTEVFREKHADSGTQVLAVNHNGEQLV
jgi:L-ascorbate metabolism protein UlaG (beta-lactamase superfamily)